MLTRREFVAASAALYAAQADPQPPGAGPLVLWYKQPAVQWTDALPIGNGRLGAMIFGGMPAERIQLNEDTLWSGAPREWNNPGAKEHLPEVRRLVLEQQDYVAADRACQQMQGPYNESYQPLGNLHIALEHSGDVSAYRRQLDLDAALSRVTYRIGDAEYTREAFASAPAQTIVLRFTTTSPGGLSLTAAIDSPLRSTSEASEGGVLRLTGKAPSHAEPNYVRSADPVQYNPLEGKGMHFEARVQAVTENGFVSSESNRLRVTGAKAVTFLITAKTGFQGYDRAPAGTAAEIAAACEKQIEAVRGQSYEALRDAHVADHRKLFRRVSLELPNLSDPALDTAERLRAFPARPDPSLAALYFQYGRYLLIASSRPGTQPANLQGIWNDQVRPPWSSNWTTNINTQMNYWHAETCNLAECHGPLFDLVEGLSKTGARTAAVNYGCRGWVSHHNVDLWRQSAPVGNFGQGSPTWANWGMSGPWFCAHLWEHYAFGGDREFLRARAYPVMKSSAEFCLDWLIERKDGRLTTCPSFSTENSFKGPDGRTAQTSDGCTMDMALIRELFSNCIEAARILGVDSDFAAKLQAARARLVPYQTGKHGQLQEWSQRFRRARARPAPHVPHVPAVPGQRDHPAPHAGARQSRARFARTAPRGRRCLYRVEPRLGHQLLGPPAGWGQGLGVCFHAAAALHRPQSFRYAPCRKHLDLPDRRQFRRRGLHRRNASPEPRRRDRLPPCPARRLARWQRQRPARPRRPHGRSLLGQGQSRLRRSRAYPGRRTHSAAAARPEDLRHPWNSRTRRRCESTAATPANLSRQLCRRCRYTSATGSPTTLK